MQQPKLPAFVQECHRKGRQAGRQAFCFTWLSWGTAGNLVSFCSQFVPSFACPWRCAALLWQILLRLRALQCFIAFTLVQEEASEVELKAKPCWIDTQGSPSHITVPAIWGASSSWLDQQALGFLSVGFSCSLLHPFLFTAAQRLVSYVLANSANNSRSFLEEAFNTRTPAVKAMHKLSTCLTRRFLWV